MKNKHDQEVVELENARMSDFLSTCPADYYTYKHDNCLESCLAMSATCPACGVCELRGFYKSVRVSVETKIHLMECECGHIFAILPYEWEEKAWLKKNTERVRWYLAMAAHKIVTHEIMREVSKEFRILAVVFSAAVGAGSVLAAFYLLVLAPAGY